MRDKYRRGAGEAGSWVVAANFGGALPSDRFREGSVAGMATIVSDQAAARPVCDCAPHAPPHYRLTKLNRSHSPTRQLAVATGQREEDRLWEVNFELLIWPLLSMPI